MSDQIYRIDKKSGMAIMTLMLECVMPDDNTALKEAFTNLLDGGTNNIILDLSKAGYVSSLILASFVFMHKRAKEAGGNLVICCINDKVKEVLSVTNLDKVFDIAKDRDEAAKKLTKK